MNVKKLSAKGNNLELEFTDASAAYMNTLRRAVTNETTTLAIELVEMRKNNSIMYDEMIAHRLGLTPLTTPVGDYALPSDEEMENQEFSAKSSVKGTLSAKGPCTVYAKDMKFKDAKVKAVYPDTPIAKLLEGQEVECEVTAVLGKGKEHSKWTPGLVYYHEIPKFKGKSLSVADERGLAKELEKIDETSKDFEARTNHYYFRVESWGQLSTTDMLTLALDELNKSLKEFDSLL